MPTEDAMSKALLNSRVRLRTTISRARYDGEMVLRGAMPRFPRSRACRLEHKVRATLETRVACVPTNELVHCVPIGLAPTQHEPIVLIGRYRLRWYRLCDDRKLERFVAVGSTAQKVGAIRPDAPLEGEALPPAQYGTAADSDRHAIGCPRVGVRTNHRREIGAELSCRSVDDRSSQAGAVAFLVSSEACAQRNRADFTTERLREGSCS